MDDDGFHAVLCKADYDVQYSDDAAAHSDGSINDELPIGSGLPGVTQSVNSESGGGYDQTRSITDEASSDGGHASAAAQQRQGAQGQRGGSRSVVSRVVSSAPLSSYSVDEEGHGSGSESGGSSRTPVSAQLGGRREGPRAGVFAWTAHVYYATRTCTIYFCMLSQRCRIWLHWMCHRTCLQVPWAEGTCKQTGHKTHCYACYGAMKCKCKHVSLVPPQPLVPFAPFLPFLPWHYAPTYFSSSQPAARLHTWQLLPISSSSVMRSTRLTWQPWKLLWRLRGVRCRH